MALHEYKIGTSIGYTDQTGNSCSLKYLAIDNRDALTEIIKVNTTVAESDLVSGLYEGGLKVWECSFDLVDYIAQNDEEFNGKTILELGCG